MKKNDHDSKMEKKCIIFLYGYGASGKLVGGEMTCDNSKMTMISTFGKWMNLGSATKLTKYLREGGNKIQELRRRRRSKVDN